MESFLAEVRRLIDHRLAEKIYIYGAGNGGRLLAEVLKKEKLAFDAYCVENAMENVTELLGHAVIQLDQLDFDADKTLFIVAVRERGAHLIKDCLMNRGARYILEMPWDIFDKDAQAVRRKANPALEITPYVGCRVNCKYCPQGLFLHNYFGENKDRAKSMTFRQYREVLAKLPKNTLIEWAGFVEPFLNKEAADMMSYTYEQGYEQTLFTTLVGMTQEDFDKIRSIPFTIVCLHVPDAEGCANIPITEEYKELLRKVVEARRSDGTLFVTNANCQNTPNPDILPITSGRLKIYCELSDRAGTIEDTDGKRIVHVDKKGKLWCDRADRLDHNVLLPDGTVVLCCNDFGISHALGNLYTQSYEEIMKGRALEQVRLGLAGDEDIPLICRKCIFAVEMKDDKAGKLG